MYRSQYCHIKGTNNNQILVIILPGLMTDAFKEIITPLKNARHKCDIASLTLYDGKTRLRRGMKEIIKEVNNFLASWSRYKKVYIIGHSWGASVLMSAKLPKNVKKIVFWSPSPWEPKNRSATLRTAGKHLYKLGSKYISKILAQDLDQLSVAELVKNIDSYKLLIYLSVGDNKKIWRTLLKNNILKKNAKIISTTYPHMYSKKQLIKLYEKTERALLN